MSSPMSPVVAQAVLFLTAPLAQIHAQEKVASIQNMLAATINECYKKSTNKLVLTLTPTHPPRPIWATCVAARVKWTAWIKVLGGQEMDLFLHADSLSLKVAGKDILLWKATRPAPLVLRSMSPDHSIPRISKFSLKSSSAPAPAPLSLADSNLKSTLTYSIARRTLAQQMIESDQETEDELFAILSKSTNTNIISPTPTRASFSIPTLPRPAAPLPTLHSAPSPISSDSDSDSNSSRPSSRSSLFSARSHSSQDSMTSFASSTASVKVTVTPPAPVECAAPRVFIAPRRTRPAAPTPAPRPFINKEKNQVQAYLYQGGKSTVLTGGVMLGKPQSAPTSSPASSASSPSPAQQKYRAPARRNPAARASNESWRRAVISRI